MERNREGRRAAATAVGGVLSITRRPRIKDASDDEDRMDEAVDTRIWERSKKERLTNFSNHPSLNSRNKRKRQALVQEPQASGGRLNASMEDLDESAEEAEAQASEDDDEPPPPPLLRRPAKARVHPKEDEMVMEIPPVPRKARSAISASSRYSSLPRRQPEPQLPDVSRQKLATASQAHLNGSSSPSFLQKQGRKLKPVGPKVRPVKVQKVVEPSTLSDQEAEVAEALFDLSRSIPSQTGMMDSKVEVKLEAEVRTGSPSTGPHVSAHHHSASTANGLFSSQLKDVTVPMVDAPKRKRPRVTGKTEDGKSSTSVRFVSSAAASSSASPLRNHSFVGETEPDSSEKMVADAASLPSESANVKAVTDSSHPSATKEKMVEPPQLNNTERAENEEPKRESQCITADTGETPSDRLREDEDGIGLLQEKDETSTSKSELPSRHTCSLRDDASDSKLNIDLMASPVKQCPLEEDTSGSAVDKQSAADNSPVHGEDQEDRSNRKVPEDPAKPVDAIEGSCMIKVNIDEEKEGINGDGEQLVHDGLPKEQVSSHVCKEEEEKDGKEASPNILPRAQEELSGNVAAAPFASSALLTVPSSSAPLPLAGWMGGLPQLGYYGPAASSWAGGASLSNASLDGKTTQSAMQLPHGPLLPPPVPRMKRCATHVFIAHFIYREQQVSRHSFWSAAICRAAPYNLNIPPVNMLENDKFSGPYLDAARKATTQQSGPSYGFSISQAGPGGITGNASTTGAGLVPAPPHHVSNAGPSGDTSSVSGAAVAASNVIAAQQYIQTVMQQNGFAASFPFPFNGPPGQAAHMFNSHFFPPHLMPPLPHLQTLPQHSNNVLPAQKQQQGVGSLPQSSASQIAASPLHHQQQQQLQLQLAPQSPSQSQQQHNQMGISPQLFGIHADKEAGAGSESASTAESLLNAIQRSMSMQQPPVNLQNLANLNMNASPLMLGTNIPSMPLHEQDGSLLIPSNVKPSAKGQQQFQGQSSASLVSSMQSQQFTTGSGASIHMNPTASQSYSAIARGPMNPSSLGLVSVTSMMGTPNLGVMSGSIDNIKGSGQQQSAYGEQQFPRSMTKASTEDAYAGKVRDYSDDKKVSMKSAGAPPLLPRVDMEVSSPALQGSPSSGNSLNNTRSTGSIGRTLPSVPTSEVRSSRPVTSGSGQPLMQNQPQKQVMGRTKPASGGIAVSTTSGHSVSTYDRMMSSNLNKFSGTGLPYSGQVPPTSQTVKPGHAAIAKVGQRLSPGSVQQQITSAAIVKGNVQQTRNNQPIPSTPPRMLPSGTTAVMGSGTLPVSTSHSLSVSKVSTVVASKSPSNGKGAVTSAKGGTPAKKSPVTGSSISSSVSSGQNMSIRGPPIQKNPASTAHIPQFSQQQQTMSAQQQRLATKNQVYPQLQIQHGQYKQQSYPPQSPYRPQLFLHQHQQQPIQPQTSSQQQQTVPQLAPMSLPHPYHLNAQSSSSQQSQALQQLSQLHHQFQTAAPQTAGNNSLSFSSSANLTLGSSMSRNLGSSTSSADGGVSRSNPAKTTYVSGTLPSGGIPEMITSAHPTVSGQVSSPNNSSSPYLQLPPVKANEQKPLPDMASREDVSNSARSSSQTPAASNPSPS
ncbi:hypothetical protein KP509_11G088100 [Ceratopteris richardii]|uniref:Protein TIME FOR COFFEE-like n=1 Tax=Ceratopteris richardii TaxID=49495 RepID=A0A8T2TXM0_CERRI|nr:hypothetical protein KP509_11G088100 [Ceratopteris richardii]KAH7426175.1 hypothetical protein KP509_11G088100 [Ceratopteris richardii]